MGFLSGIAARGAFTKFREEVVLVYVDVVKRERHLEPFQGYMKIWQVVLTRYSKTTIAISAEHIVKYFAVVQPVEAVELLVQHMAKFVISDFSSTSFFRAHEESMRNFLATQGCDGGARLNGLFKQINPKSYDWFVERYGAPPFSPNRYQQLINSASQ